MLLLPLSMYVVCGGERQYGEACVPGCRCGRERERGRGLLGGALIGCTDPRGALTYDCGRGRGDSER